MARYWASPTGNDSNDGSTEALAKTFDGAWTAANAQGDEIICADGTYTLTATKTPTVSITVIAKNRRAAIFTGNFSFSGASAVKMIYSGLLFKNASGTNGVSGSHITGNSGALSAFEDCGWDMSSYTNGACFSHIITSSSFYNCDFANAVFVDGSSSQGYVYNNCTFKNISNYVINGTGKMAEFFACIFYKVSKCHNAPIATTPVQDFTSFKHCTFDLTDGNGTGTPGDIWYNTTASGTQTVYARFFNNIVYNVRKIVNNSSSGTMNVDGGNVKNNWINSGITIANYTGTGDITAYNDPKFYSVSTQDYRLEPTSTAAIGNNGFTFTCGAMELESPDTFFTSLSASQVQSGVSFKQKSRTNNVTGTYAGSYLAASSVKIGVDRGDGTLGTYDGSDRWSDPGTTNVRSGTAYKANSTTNNKTGSAVIPAASVVKLGVAVDATTGTLESTDPGVANVKKSVTYKIESTSYTGTLESTDPGVANVVSGINYKIESVSKTGTYVPPTSTDPGVSNVKEGTNYQINGVSKTGTLHLATYTDPGEANVHEGTSYTFNDVVKNGSFHAPVSIDPGTDKVLAGTSYTINDVIKEGAYTPPTSTDPGQTNVLEGIGYVINDVPKTGSYVAPASTDPGESNVKKNVIYAISGVSKTGTLESTNPGAENVTDGVSYIIENESFVGTAPNDRPSIDPGEYNVLKDVAYNIDGVSKVGKYDRDINNTPATGISRVDILRQIEDTLYSIRPSTDSKYQSIIRKVDVEVGRRNMTIETEEMPHVQVIADNESYNDRYIAFGGAYPFINKLITLRVTAPADYTQMDMEAIKDDIEQALCSGDFNLNGKAIEVSLLTNSNLQREDDSETSFRQFEIEIKVFFDRNLN